MKRLLTILLLFSLHASATNYYVSNTGSDAAAGTSTGTAWQTIAKVNSFWSAGSFTPGDSILFKRGDTWIGEQIVPQESGTAGNPIVIGAYGSGARPVITGFATITGWGAGVGNIYESTAAVSTLSTLNMVTVNGVSYAMGRYPNADASNKGWLTIDSHVSDSVITDAALPSGTTNWTGARAVVRVSHYIIDTSIIESHSGNTFHLTSSKITTTLIDGYGYFIENDARTLDQHGEWYYDISTNKLKIYLTTDPANYTIKVAARDNLISLANDDYITVDNINFQGANQELVAFSGSSDHVTFQNCDLLFAGDKAVESRSSGTNTLTFTNCNVEDANNFGMDFRGSGDGMTVTSSTFNRIAMFAGMNCSAGGATGQAMMGIVVNSGKNHTITSNVMDSLGFHGIRFGLIDSVLVQYNYISNFNITVDDGGAIYCYGSKNAVDAPEKFGRRILDNVMINGPGVKEGTTELYGATSGIYIDDNSSGIEIARNTVYNCDRTGMYVHNSWNLNIHDNTFYANGGTQARYQVQFNRDISTSHDIEGITFKHNKLISKVSNQVTMYLTNTLSTGNTINQFGTFDSNYYARPIAQTTLLRYRNLGGTATNVTLAGWQAAWVHDDNSAGSPVTFSDADSTDYYLVFLYNGTASPVTEDLIDGAAYTTVDGDDYSESAEVPAYGSLLLLRTPDPPEPPAPAATRALKNNGKVLKTGGGKILVIQ